MGSIPVRQVSKCAQTALLSLSLAISKLDHEVLRTGLARREVGVLNTTREKQSLEFRVSS